MVNTGRADYWLESIWADDPEINQIVKFNDEGYSMEFFRKNPLHLVFADTQRGRNFLTIWNKDFAELIRDEVAYRKAYRLNIPDIFSTPELSAYLVFMRKEVPELFQ